MITLTAIAKQKAERILGNKYFSLERNSWQAGYEWGYSEAMTEMFNKNVQLGVEISSLKEKIADLEAELNPQ